MLPNMSRTVLRFSQTIIKKEITQSVVNHKVVKTTNDTPFEAAVTTPKTDDLVTADIDSNLIYKNIHSNNEIKMDDIFEHRNINYKIIQLKDRLDYGYYSGLGEEVQ